MSKWIRVEDKLPDIGTNVLAVNNNKVHYARIEIGKLDIRDIWYAPTYGILTEVTYWMPIPPTPTPAGKPGRGILLPAP